MACSVCLTSAMLVKSSAAGFIARKFPMAELRQLHLTGANRVSFSKRQFHECRTVAVGFISYSFDLLVRKYCSQMFYMIFNPCYALTGLCKYVVVRINFFFCNYQLRCTNHFVNNRLFDDDDAMLLTKCVQ